MLLMLVFAFGNNMKSLVKLSFHKMSLRNVDFRNVSQEDKVDYIMLSK